MLDVDIVAIVADELGVVHIDNLACHTLARWTDIGSLEGENSEQQHQYCEHFTHNTTKIRKNFDIYILFYIFVEYIARLSSMKNSLFGVIATFVLLSVAAFSEAATVRGKDTCGGKGVGGVDRPYCRVCAAE